jgi:hypothetical protein
MKDNTFFMQFGFALVILLGYFTSMFVISLQFIYSTQVITAEMNLVSQAESYYAFTQNVQREMVYDPDKAVLSTESFEVARDSLEILYNYNMLLQHIHYENREQLNPDYKQVYDDYFKLNVCQNNMTVKLELLPF